MISNFLTIDGGVHKCAVGEWNRARLSAVYFQAGPLADAPSRQAFRLEFDRVIVERPIIRGNATPDPQTIVDLAWESAALAFSYGIPVEAVTPHQWKGEIPKPVHHNRVLLAPVRAPGLDPGEEAILERALPGWKAQIRKALGKCIKSPGKRGAEYYGTWEGHNLIDAVCLGIWVRSGGIPS